MEVYVEKEFIEKINEDYQNKIETTSSVLDTIVSVLTDYGNVNIFIDCNINTLKQLESKNEIIATRTTKFKGPVPIDKTIKEFFLDNAEYDQTLIFVMNEDDWLNKAEEKGVLCFTYKNYETKIVKILNICNSIKIDLSERFPGWNSFNALKEIPKNYILLNDKYILKNEAITQNYIPLVKSLLSHNTQAKIEVYTDFLNFPAINQRAIHSDLCEEFNTDYTLDIEIIHLNQYHSLNFHDRILYSNFFIIECPIGFNFKTNKTSNSKITVDSIFDKFNYKRINNHLYHLQKAKENATIIQSL